MTEYVVSTTDVVTIRDGETVAVFERSPEGEEAYRIFLAGCTATDNTVWDENKPAYLEDAQQAAVKAGRPLLAAIAAWETQNGTLAAILPGEYAAFMEGLITAARKGSARRAISAQQL